MGTSISQLKDSSQNLDRVRRSLFNISLDKIISAHCKFRSLCSKFTISSHEYCAIFQSKEIPFEIWDPHQITLVDALEIFSGLIVVANINFEDQVKFLFDLYDFNEINSLSLADVELMFKSILGSLYKINRISSEPDFQENLVFASKLFEGRSRINFSQLYNFLLHAEETNELYLSLLKQSPCPKFVSEIDEIREKENPKSSIPAYLRTHISKIDKISYNFYHGGLILNSKHNKTKIKVISSFAGSQIPKEQLIAPVKSSKMSLNWIYGFSSDSLIRSFLVSTSSREAEKMNQANNKIIYSVSNIVIIYYYKLNKQAHFIEHTNEISSISISRSGLICSSGQTGKNPKILIWKIATLKTQSVIYIGSDCEAYLLEFLNNDKFLALVCKKPESAFQVYDLETQTKIMSTYVKEFILNLTSIKNLSGKIVDNFDDCTIFRDLNINASFLCFSESSVYIFGFLHSKKTYSFHQIELFDNNSRSPEFYHKITSGVMLYANKVNPESIIYKSEEDFELVCYCGTNQGQILKIANINLTQKQIDVQRHCLQNIPNSSPFISLLHFKEQFLCAATEEQQIYLIDLVNGGVFQHIDIKNLDLRLKDLQIKNIERGENGKLFAGTWSGDLFSLSFPDKQIWNNRQVMNVVRTKKFERIFKIEKGLDSICLIEPNRKERYIYISGAKNSVCGFSAKSRDLVDSCTLEDRVTCMDCFSQVMGGTVFAFGTSKGKIRIRFDCEMISKHFQCEKAITVLKFSDSGSHLVAGTSEPSIILFGYLNGTYFHDSPKIVLNHEIPISINFCRHLNEFVLCTDLLKYYHVKIAEFREKKMYEMQSSDVAKCNLIQTKYVSEKSKCRLPVLILPDLGIIISGEIEGIISVYDSVANLKENCGTFYYGHSSAISALKISNFRDKLYSVAANDGGLFEWNIELVQGVPTSPVVSNPKKSENAKKDYPIPSIKRQILANSIVKYQPEIVYDSFGYFRSYSNNYLRRIFGEKYETFDEEEGLHKRCPQYSLSLKHVYGYDAYNYRKNVLYLHSSRAGGGQPMKNSSRFVESDISIEELYEAESGGNKKGPEGPGFFPLANKVTQIMNMCRLANKKTTFAAEAKVNDQEKEISSKIFNSNNENINQAQVFFSPEQDSNLFSQHFGITCKTEKDHKQTQIQDFNSAFITCSIPANHCNREIIYFVSRIAIIIDPLHKNSQRFYQGHTSKISAIALHPNIPLVATGETCYHPKIHIWKIESCSTMTVIDTFHKLGIICLKFTHGKEIVVSASVDSCSSIQASDWTTGKVVAFRNTSNRKIIDLIVDPIDPYSFVTANSQRLDFWLIKGSSIINSHFLDFDNSAINLFFTNMVFMTYWSQAQFQKDLLVTTANGKLIIIRNKKFLKAVDLCLKDYSGEFEKVEEKTDQHGLIASGNMKRSLMAATENPNLTDKVSEENLKANITKRSSRPVITAQMASMESIESLNSLKGQICGNAYQIEKINEEIEEANVIEIDQNLENQNWKDDNMKIHKIEAENSLAYQKNSKDNELENCNDNLPDITVSMIDKMKICESNQIINNKEVDKNEGSGQLQKENKYLIEQKDHFDDCLPEISSRKSLENEMPIKNEQIQKASQNFSEKAAQDIKRKKYKINLIKLIVIRSQTFIFIATDDNAIQIYNLNIDLVYEFLVQKKFKNETSVKLKTKQKDSNFQDATTKIDKEGNHRDQLNYRSAIICPNKNENNNSQNLETHLHELHTKTLLNKIKKKSQSDQKNFIRYEIQSIDIYIQDKHILLLVSLSIGTIKEIKLKLTITQNSGEGQPEIITFSKMSSTKIIECHASQNFTNLDNDFNFINYKRIYISVNPIHNIMATCGEDKVLHFWDFETKKLLLSKSLDHVPTCVKFSPLGKILVIGLLNGNIMILEPEVQRDSENYKSSFRLKLEKPVQVIDPFFSQSDDQKAREDKILLQKPVLNLEFSLRGDLLAVAHDNVKLSTNKDNLKDRGTAIVIVYVSKDSQLKDQALQSGQDNYFMKYAEVRLASLNYADTSKMSYLGMASYFMAFSDDDTYLMLYYQNINEHHIRENRDKEGKYVIWNFKSRSSEINWEILKNVQFKSNSFPNHIYGINSYTITDKLDNQMSLVKRAKLGEEMRNNQIVLSAINNLSNVSFFGSEQGDLFIAKKTLFALKQKDSPENLALSSLCQAKRYRAHSSFVNQIEISSNGKNLFSTGINDECIFEWNITKIEAKNDLDHLLNSDIHQIEKDQNLYFFNTIDRDFNAIQTNQDPISGDPEAKETKELSNSRLLAQLLLKNSEIIQNQKSNNDNNTSQNVKLAESGSLIPAIKFSNQNDNEFSNREQTEEIFYVTNSRPKESFFKISNNSRQIFESLTTEVYPRRKRISKLQQEIDVSSFPRYRLKPIKIIGRSAMSKRGNLALIENKMLIYSASTTLVITDLDFQKFSDLPNKIGSFTPNQINAQKPALHNRTISIEENQKKSADELKGFKQYSLSRKSTSKNGKENLVDLNNQSFQNPLSSSQTCQNKNFQQEILSVGQINENHHPSEIACFELASDERTICVGINDIHANLLLWEITSNVFKGSITLTNCIAPQFIRFSVDMKTLMVLGLVKNYNSCVYFVDIQNYKILGMLDMIHSPTFKIWDAAFHPLCNDKFITVGLVHASYWNYRAETLDFKEMKIESPISLDSNAKKIPSEENNEDEYLITSFLIIKFLSPEIFITACSKGSLYLWIHNEIRVQKLAYTNSPVSAIAVNPEKPFDFLVGGFRVPLHYYRVDDKDDHKTFYKLYEINIFDESVIKTLKNLNDKTETAVQSLPEFEVQSLIFSQSGNIIYGTRNGNLGAFYLSKDVEEALRLNSPTMNFQGQSKREKKEQLPAKAYVPLNNHIFFSVFDNHIPRVADFSQDGSKIFCITEEGLFSVYDFSTLTNTFRHNFQQLTQDMIILDNSLIIVFENYISVIQFEEADYFLDLDAVSLMTKSRQINKAKVHLVQSLMAIAFEGQATSFPIIEIYNIDSQVYSKFYTIETEKIELMDFSRENALALRVCSLMYQDIKGKMRVFKIEKDKITEDSDDNIEWASEGIMLSSANRTLKSHYKASNYINSILKIDEETFVVSDELGTVS